MNARCSWLMSFSPAMHYAHWLTIDTPHGPKPAFSFLVVAILLPLGLSRQTFAQFAILGGQSGRACVCRVQRIAFPQGEPLHIVTITKILFSADTKH